MSLLVGGTRDSRVGDQFLGRDRPVQPASPLPPVSCPQSLAHACRTSSLDTWVRKLIVRWTDEHCPAPEVIIRRSARGGAGVRYRPGDGQCYPGLCARRLTIVARDRVP